MLETRRRRRSNFQSGCEEHRRCGVRPEKRPMQARRKENRSRKRSPFTNSSSSAVHIPPTLLERLLTKAERWKTGSVEKALVTFCPPPMTPKTKKYDCSLPQCALNDLAFLKTYFCLEEQRFENVFAGHLRRNKSLLPIVFFSCISTVTRAPLTVQRKILTPAQGKKGRYLSSRTER